MYLYLCGGFAVEQVSSPSEMPHFIISADL